jgi:hypothetical protein
MDSDRSGADRLVRFDRSSHALCLGHVYDFEIAFLIRLQLAKLKKPAVSAFFSSSNPFSVLAITVE